jgi:hypothetical protein
MFDLILYILALICFVIATFNLSARVNFVALGLAFWVCTLLFTGITVGTKGG